MKKGFASGSSSDDDDAAPPPPNGPALIALLRRRGEELNALCQDLISAIGGAGRKEILDMLEGRRQRWPNVPPAAVSQKMAVARAWAKLCVDIRGYTASLLSPTAYASSGGAAAHETYLRRVVLARVHLEATASAAEACCRRVAAARCVSVADVSSLHSRGFAIVDDVLGRAGIDCAALTRDIALLHKHGVIAPTNSSCNPGACGINLRCGTDDERAAFDKQRTPTLRAAIELLRSLPQVLLGLGYRGTRGGGSPPSLLVPPTILLSAYGAGAHYSRHLDCYGDDNARYLTAILYANDTKDHVNDGGRNGDAGAESWCIERDGGALRLEERDGAAARDVAPLAGRLVLFESRQIWHAVRQAKRLRFAVTLWVYALAEEEAVDIDEQPTPPSNGAPVAARGAPTESVAALRGASLSRCNALVTLATDASTRRTGYRWIDIDIIDD